MNNQLLKKYKAKSDDTTIYQHNKDLLSILKQLENIHKINNSNNITLKKAINYHDIGKCTSSFQNNIESKQRTIRHEILSASCEELSDNERNLILLHHKTLDGLQKYIDNEYLESELLELSNSLNIKHIDMNTYLKNICKYNRKNIKILSDKDLILNLGYLKLCDHIASAGIKVIDSGLNTREVYNFPKYKSIQTKVLNLKQKTDIIIQAPTGIGKTETSLLWSDLVQNVNKSRRIFYILPYIASINSLYKRFKTDGISVGVLHSKVKSLLNKEEDIDDIKEELELFKKNIKQVTVSTLFQLVKAMFQCKNFEMLLAQLNYSIIVIDEIHCFDIRNFTLLIETLKYLKTNLGVSICIMSASIPTCMLNKIKEELSINTVINADKEDYLMRHHINYIDDIIDSHLDSIENNLNNNKQVLICVNNVEYSQEIYKHFKNIYPNKNIKLIHSRFNARDRTEHEKDLKNCDLLIGTQAIEVSLDIDYDILYTELAPLDSLLQRFGRVNRKGIKGISEVNIFNENNERSVYDEEILIRTKEVLFKIAHEDLGVVYEHKVNTYLDIVYPSFDETKYNEIRNDFNKVIEKLHIGYYNENATEELIGENNTITALPISLIETYNTYRNNKQYIEANELMVGINEYWGNYYFDKDLNIVISEYKYNSDIGLIKELDIYAKPNKL